MKEDSKEIRILLVEDNPTDVQLIRRQISKMTDEVQIRTVSQLAEVQTELKVFAPDLILSDYNLPTCTGMDVLELCRDVAPESQFVFLTGTLQNEELAAETILAGADGFVLKTNMSQLHERLGTYFEKVKKNRVVHAAKSRIESTSDLVSRIQTYLKDISEEKLSHQERIEKIRKHLEEMKKKI